MKKTIQRSGLILALLIASVFSQEESGIAVTAAALGIFPGGKYEDRAGVGYGGLGGVELGGMGLSLTARSGYLRHLARGGSQVSMIPFLGGLKASTNDGSVYIDGEFGAALTKTHFSGALSLNDDEKKTNLVWGVGVGSVVGTLDLRFFFNAWDARNLSDAMSVGLSLGLLFWGT